MVLVQALSDTSEKSLTDLVSSTRLRIVSNARFQKNIIATIDPSMPLWRKCRMILALKELQPHKAFDIAGEGDFLEEDKFEVSVILQCALETINILSQQQEDVSQTHVRPSLHLQVYWKHAARMLLWCALSVAYLLTLVACWFEYRPSQLFACVPIPLYVTEWSFSASCSLLRSSERYLVCLSIHPCAFWTVRVDEKSSMKAAACLKTDRRIGATHSGRRTGACMLPRRVR